MRCIYAIRNLETNKKVEKQGRARARTGAGVRFFFFAFSFPFLTCDDCFDERGPVDDPSFHFTPAFSFLFQILYFSPQPLAPLLCSTRHIPSGLRIIAPITKLRSSPHKLNLHPPSFSSSRIRSHISLIAYSSLPPASAIAVSAASSSFPPRAADALQALIGMHCRRKR